MSSRSESVCSGPVRSEQVHPEPAYDGYFADPFLTRFDGGFIAYGSGDDRALDGTETRAFEALRSPDLVNWTSAGGVLERLDPSLGDAYWAPEVVASDGAYWMFFSVGHGIAGHHLRVARADSPLGPFVDQGVNLTPGESFAIDAHPFRDADGSWYLFFARDVLTGTRPGTHLAVLRLDGMTRAGSDPVAVLAPDADWQLYARARRMYGRTLDWHTLEGPAVVRRDDQYHLFFSGGSWEGDGYGVSVATAPHPLGPWTHEPRAAADVLSTGLTGLLGPGHNSVLRLDDGADLIAFHAWDAGGGKRQLFIAPLDWSGGLPRVVLAGPGSAAGPGGAWRA
ncbi:glycoside hydrolase family 43 protein [Leifsonia shinshuensis]|uniref:Beta-xylosidase n=1 Tax=Leifsonia shinshuensis TaxID=150026 RepID=A0A853CRK2_9MICO|nr:glycoside hydrolase family 43 protein [Leifsonia shinshuensis]NYJ23317.1 beta-xylosidase [Leifsonia shinshuensis]